MILYDRYYLQNCKTITSEKLQIIQNMKDLMFQVIFIFSDWILIKQIIVSSIPFYSWGKRNNVAWGNEQFPPALGVMTKTWGQVLSGEDNKWKCLESVHFPGMWTPSIWKFFPHLVEYKSLKENSASILERDKALRSL